MKLRFDDRSKRMVTGVLLGLIGSLLLASAVWAAGGDVLWVDQFDLAGGADVGVSVAVQGRQVFVAGRATDAAGDTGFLIRAHDTREGALLWQDSFHNPGAFTLGVEVVAHGGQAYAGFTSTTAGNRSMIVRAYDGRTGSLLWADQHDIGGGPNAAFAIAADAQRVYASGARQDSPGNLDFLVRTYDAKTGTLLWEDVFDHAGLDDVAIDVAVRGGQVFAAGYAETAAGGQEALVRSYDAKTGTLLWQNIFDLAGFVDQIREIVVRGNRVYAAGFGRTAAGSPNEDLLVMAYDADTGALVWQDQFDLAGGSDVAYRIALAGPRVFAARSAINAAGDQDLLVRAYDANTGAFLWQDVRDEAGDFDAAHDIVASGDRVYVSGNSVNANGDRDFIVLSYDASTGEVIWEDRVDLAGGTDFGQGLALHEDIVFVAGKLADALGNQDWVVRAYEAR